MNDENLSIKDILDWYVTAGVDEIVGDVPFGKDTSAGEKAAVRIAPKPDSVVKPVGLATHPVQAESAAEGRKATTELAQATINACKMPANCARKPEHWKSLRSWWKILRAAR